MHGRRDSRDSSFDVCVVGHVTRDITITGEKTTSVPGGTAYYTSLALKRFGLKVVVVTKTAREDKAFLLGPLEREGIETYCEHGRESLVFENRYDDRDPDVRVQWIRSLGDPFPAQDVQEISATVIHVGPLTSDDISLELLRQLSAKEATVSLDVQGLLRPARVGLVMEEDWLEKQEGLACVDILRADEKEALVLSGQQTVEGAAVALGAFGPKEVVITMGSRGSLIYAEEGFHWISAFHPRTLGDPTGCGDTYTAGYLYQRLKGMPPKAAGRFAAGVATLKLEGNGPFRGTETDVKALLISRA